MPQLYVEFTGIIGAQFVVHVNTHAIVFHRIPGSDKQIARIEREEDYRWLIANDPRIIPYSPSEEGLSLLAEVEAAQIDAAEKAAQAEAVAQAEQTLRAVILKKQKLLEAAAELIRQAGQIQMDADSIGEEIEKAEARVIALSGKAQEDLPEPNLEESAKAKPRRKTK